MKNSMQAGVFKAQCLKVLDEVNIKKKTFIITKRGKPVAQIIPFEKDDTELFGKLRNSVKITGDIVNALEENWNADY